MLGLKGWRSRLASARAKRYWREVDSFAALEPEQARQELGRRLLAQIRYFGGRGDALPEWREAAAIRDVDELWRVWRELPILTKRDLQTRFSPEVLRSQCGVQGVESSSGGSTGEPTPFLHDSPMLAAMRALRFYCQCRMGWRPGMARICVWGSERDIGRQRRLKSRIAERLRNRCIIDGYRLDGQTVDRVLAVLRRQRQAAMYGFTSMLEFVAREALARGDLPPAGRVHTAWNGGEMLFDTQSVLFERAFGVPILNFYGGRELSAMAFQPRVGASLCVLRPFLFAELVDDAGRPVPPGQTGRLIWTSTICRGTPFLRYDVGDVATSTMDDQDESGICRLTSLCGRHAGLLTLPGGKVINNLFWNHLFKEFPEVFQFQVALQGDRGIVLRLRGRQFCHDREMQLRNTLLNFLGPIPVRLDWMERIPLTQQGKLLQVVREAA